MSESCCVRRCHGVPQGLLVLLGVLMGVLLVSLALVGPAAAQTNWPPPDVDEALCAQYGLSLEQLQGISEGYPSGYWHPYEPVTRAQAAKFAVLAFNLTPLLPATSTFPDVERDHTLYPYVEAAVAAGEAQGGPTLLPSSGSRETARRTPEPVALSPLPFTARDVSTLMEEHLRATELHARTRGTHGSSLAGETGILITREDIGRHNTIDMIGGHLFLQKGDGAGKLLLTTGRLSSEMVRKVWNLGIPAVASHAAATSEGIETAERGGLTLMGCVRNGTMKIYTHHERIRF